jgi:hypothetical protein
MDDTDLAREQKRGQLLHALGLAGTPWAQAANALDAFEMIIIDRYKQDHNCPNCGWHLGTEDE